MKLRTFLTLVLVLPALITAGPVRAQDAAEMLRLPLRVHLVSGVEMTRELPAKGGAPSRLVMNLPVSIEEAGVILKQVNQIWAPAGIHWETDPAKGGGGIIREQAGGGKLAADRLKELADLVVARNRESKLNYMGRIFPALADPANNESISDDGTLNKTKPVMYHLYLFPYVGQTLQGTARLSGTFAVVGAYSDKSNGGKRLPKPRPHCVPAKDGAKLSPENFPDDGTLSATIAHELGHNLSLTHVDEGMQDNLMKGRVKLRLGPLQMKQARTQALLGPLLK